QGGMAPLNRLHKELLKPLDAFLQRSRIRSAHVFLLLDGEQGASKAVDALHNIPVTTWFPRDPAFQAVKAEGERGRNRRIMTNPNRGGNGVGLPALRQLFGGTQQNRGDAIVQKVQ